MVDANVPTRGAEYTPDILRGSYDPPKSQSDRMFYTHKKFGQFTFCDRASVDVTFPDGR